MSSKKLDRIVVIDLEATCWENKDGFKTPPPGEQSEIIEIGACFLDIQTGKVSQKTSYLVRPYHSKISPFCTQLTGYTQEVVNKGIAFEHAVNKMKKEFGTINRIWASWGDYDRTAFERNCKLYNTKYPFGRRHINAKTMFSILNKLPKEIGVMAALKYYNMNFIGQQHKGCDDAYNTARIMAEMFRK